MNRFFACLCSAALAIVSFAAAPAIAQDAPATGACCVRAADGAVSCQVLTRRACYAAHGFYRGDASTCGDNTCAPPPPPPPPPTGACCARGADGAVSCAVATRRACADHHGHYLGDNTACAADSCPPPPPPPTGACCTRGADGAVTCTVGTRFACGASHGHYLGDNSACADDSCAPPPPPVVGACCLARAGAAGCAVLPAAICARLNGTYAGDGSACADAICPPPPPPATGACCIAPDASGAGGGCQVLSRQDCYRAHGRYRGDNSACDDTACTPPARGACCLANDRCCVAPAAICSRLNGQYGGDGSSCDAGCGDAPLLLPTSEKSSVNDDFATSSVLSMIKTVLFGADSDASISALSGK